MRNRSEQTICAVSTPQGTGGIAVIRVSGTDALKNCQKIIPTLQNRKIQTHHTYFAGIYDENKEPIDEAVIAFFAEGKSFTGEEVVEISCHGSEYITAKIIDLLIDCGCVLAEKGEFTFRAFMNNRIDLVQAEAVLSMIESQNKASARIALRQLQGMTSKKFAVLENDLTWCLAHIEASIDFSTEGLEVVDPLILLQKLRQIRAELETLVLSYRAGRLIKEGIKAVLLGKPNAGKSSLLNIFAEDDRAIVTPIAGTTRDIIHATAMFQGLRYTISDTAGLRETKDVVESIGVQRSQIEATKADVILYVLDATDDDWNEAAAYLNGLIVPFVVLLHKADLISTDRVQQIRKKLQNILPVLGDGDVIFTSHLDPTARDRVLTLVKDKMGNLNTLEEALVTSARQYETASYALEMLDVSLLELEKNAGAEFIAMYLKESLISIQKILGHVFDDQIMDRVFKEFCLGK